MERGKELLTCFRNAVAFCFSWLVACSMAVALLNGKDALGIGFLLKLLVLCIWASFCFVLCFRTQRIQKKGFLFSFSCFYVMFIPVETGLFYLMGLFKGTGSPFVWILFFLMAAVTYVASFLIDHTVMKKNARNYTQKLTEYIRSQ